MRYGNIQRENTISRQADLAYTAIRTQIILCHLAPGSEVTEGGLAEAMGFGRASIRAALMRLAQDGIVHALPRRGYRIAPITLKEVFEVFEFRLILETAAAKAAAGNVNKASLIQADQEWTEIVGRSSEDISHESLLANKRFHLIIAEHTGNTRLIKTLSSLLDETDRMISLALPVAMAHSEIQEGHQPIIDALVEGSAEDAETAVAVHVQNAKAIVVEALLAQTDLQRAEIQIDRAGHSQ